MESSGDDGGAGRSLQPSAGRPTARAGSAGAAWTDGRGGAPAERAPDLGVYARVLREQYWLVLLVFVVVTAAVAAGTLSSPDIYRATATLEIRRQAAEVVPVESFSQLERISEQYLQTQYALLRGAGLVRRAVADPVLAARVAGSEHPEVAAQSLVPYVQKRLTVDPVAGSRIVRVSFEQRDPALAADVVNAVVAAYLAMREEAGFATLVRLGEQADSVRAHVLVAERELQQFVRANGLGGVIGDGEGETVPKERLRRLQQELTAAEAEAYQAEAVSAAVGSGSPALADSDLLKTLRARIAELQGDYARLRSTFTDSFPRTRQVRSELAQLDSLLAREEQRVVTTLVGQHQSTLRRRMLLQAAVNEQRLLMDSLAASVAEHDRLRRDLDGQEQLYATLQQKRKEATISAALSTMDVAVLDPAAPPTSPVRPLPKRDIPIGALAGLVLGLGLAFVRHLADGSVRTVEDVREMTGAPVLAMIPTETLPRATGRRASIGRRRRQQWHRIDLPGTSFSALDEAFSGLRTSMLYDMEGPERRTLLITSSRPNEGKTTVSTNLAISLARLGRRVLLVDTDMRRPSLHRVFSIANDDGLADYLEEVADWREVVHHEVLPGLDVIPAGTESRSPADDLSSARVVRLLAQAQRNYDFVLLDAPALFLNVPDARILARMVDGVILVVRSGVAAREVVRQLIGHVDNLMGVVLNQMDLRHLPAYYREYGDRGGSSRRTNGARSPDPSMMVTSVSVDQGEHT